MLLEGLDLHWRTAAIFRVVDSRRRAFFYAHRDKLRPLVVDYVVVNGITQCRPFAFLIEEQFHFVVVATWVLKRVKAFGLVWILGELFQLSFHFSESLRVGLVGVPDWITRIAEVGSAGPICVEIEGNRKSAQ